MNFNHSLEAVLAQTLLHSLWQIAVLGLLAAMLLGLLHRRSAALKHFVGMSFLMMMMAAPVQTFLLLMAENANAGTTAHTEGVLPLLLPVMLNLPLVTSSTSGLVLPWLWCAGVLFMLLRLIGGWMVLRKLDHQTALALPAVWQQRAESIRTALGIRRKVTIKLLKNMGLPCTARAWHPIVWLPISILTQLTPDQIEALIAHELAHIRRLDWIWNALQCLIEAVLFYHPAVWWLNRRIRQERENACDDLAVAVCGDAIVLAEALATLERDRSPAHKLALSSDGGSLMQRITRLLSPDSPAKIRWAVPMGLMALLCTGVFLAAQASYATGNASATSADQSWWTHIGESTEIRETNDQGVSRVYHKWIDLSGNPHETFRVNDKLTPIDKNVRLWLKQQMASNHPPAPPVAPPPPPAPPALPSLEESEVVQAAVQAARLDSRMVAVLGSPIIAESLEGPSYSDDDEAQLSLVLSGSKGRADVQAVGEKTNGVWIFSKLDIESVE
ncbi:MAG: M56 family metallopeptidase, partial [Arenimonas sp.]